MSNKYIVKDWKTKHHHHDEVDTQYTLASPFRPLYFQLSNLPNLFIRFIKQNAYVSVHFAAWCIFVWNPSRLHALLDVVHLAVWCVWETPQTCCLCIAQWSMNEWCFLPCWPHCCLSHTLRGGDPKLGWQVGSNVVLECYLVDPASNHMLVLKIKSCLCKYELTQTVKLRWLIKLISLFDGICYSDNYSKS